MLRCRLCVTQMPQAMPQLSSGPQHQHVMQLPDGRLVLEPQQPPLFAPPPAAAARLPAEGHVMVMQHPPQPQQHASVSIPPPGVGFLPQEQQQRLFKTPDGRLVVLQDPIASTSRHPHQQLNPSLFLSPASSVGMATIPAPLSAAPAFVGNHSPQPQHPTMMQQFVVRAPDPTFPLAAAQNRPPQFQQPLI